MSVSSVLTAALSKSRTPVVTPDGRYLYAVGQYQTNGEFRPGALIDTEPFATRPFDGVLAH